MGLEGEGGGTGMVMPVTPMNNGGYPVYMGGGNNSGNGFGDGNGW